MRGAGGGGGGDARGCSTCECLLRAHALEDLVHALRSKSRLYEVGDGNRTNKCTHARIFALQ